MRFVVAAGILVAAAALVLWPRGSALGGKTGDQIAERIDRECGDNTRTKLDPSDFDYPGVMRQADEVIFITCPSGYVNPFADLIRFSSSATLAHAFTTGGKQTQANWFCIAGREAVAGDFSGFAGLCNQIGGHFRCPPGCRERVGDHRIPPPPS